MLTTCCEVRRFLKRSALFVLPLSLLFLPPWIGSIVMTAWMALGVFLIWRTKSQWRDWHRRRAEGAATQHHEVPRWDDSPAAVGQPITILQPEHGESIMDPTARPAWVDAAIDAGADVRADVFGNEPNRVRFTARSDHAVRVVRVDLTDRERRRNGV